MSANIFKNSPRWTADFSVALIFVPFSCLKLSSHDASAYQVRRTQRNKWRNKRSLSSFSMVFLTLFPHQLTALSTDTIGGAAHSDHTVSSGGASVQAVTCPSLSSSSASSSTSFSSVEPRQRIEVHDPDSDAEDRTSSDEDNDKEASAPTSRGRSRAQISGAATPTTPRAALQSRAPLATLTPGLSNSVSPSAVIFMIISSSRALRGMPVHTPLHPDLNRLRKAIRARDLHPLKDIRGATFVCALR